MLTPLNNNFIAGIMPTQDRRKPHDRFKRIVLFARPNRRRHDDGVIYTVA
jgi:hypothetical protein